MPEPFANTANGKQEIHELLHQLRGSKEFFVQFVHSGLVQLNGDEAAARWIIHEVGMGPGGKSGQKSYYTVFIFANDELRKIDGKWLIESRNYPYIFLNTDPFTGKAIPLRNEVRFR